MNTTADTFPFPYILDRIAFLEARILEADQAQDLAEVAFYQGRLLWWMAQAGLHHQAR